MTILNFKTPRSVEREKFYIAREFFLRPGVLKESDHGLRLGSVDDYYFDLDYVLNDPYQCEIVLGIYTDLVLEISQKVPIDFLAFLDKASGGTVGAIRLSAALSVKTKLPNVVVRPGKAISFEKVKVPFAEAGLKGRRAIVVSDHCTSGCEVLLAVDILRENNAIVEHAVVYTIRQDKLEWSKYKKTAIDLRHAFKLPTHDKTPHSLEELDAIAINF